MSRAVKWQEPVLDGSRMTDERNFEEVPYSSRTDASKIVRAYFCQGQERHRDKQTRLLERKKIQNALKKWSLFIF